MNRLFARIDRGVEHEAVFDEFTVTTGEGEDAISARFQMASF